VSSWIKCTTCHGWHPGPCCPTEAEIQQQLRELRLQKIAEDRCDRINTISDPPVRIPFYVSSNRGGSERHWSVVDDEPICGDE
jgi:hypothetical protein